MPEPAGELKLIADAAGKDRRTGMPLWWRRAARAGVPTLGSASEAGPNDCVVVVRGNPERARREAGGPGRGSLSPWIMNASSSEVTALSPEQLEARLRREGIPAHIGVSRADRSETGNGSEGTPITVAVWGLEAVEMRRDFAGGAGRAYGRAKPEAGYADASSIGQEHPLWKPAAKLAARAIYCLGLDYGQVRLKLSDQGRFSVTEVSPEPRLATREGAGRWREAVLAFADAWRLETSGTVAGTTLGADPEFVLVSKAGKVVPASRYFPTDGEAGCDSIRVGGEKIWPLVELRPRPRREPSQLAAELRRLLLAADERTEGAAASWRAGALPIPGLPLGGHVHVGGAALHGERLRALDNAVALPLRLLEPAGAAGRRPKYGALGDFRRQPHGGFEYRTPPSWLVSPRLTIGVLALAKVAAEHSRELASAGRPLDEARVRGAFYEGERSVLAEAASRVYEAISRTKGYSAYREEIDFVFGAIADGRSWNEKADIRIKWRIPIR